GLGVVADLERPQAPLACVDGCDLVLAAALPASKSLYVRHADAPFAVLRGADCPPLSTRSRAPRAEIRSSATHRSGIGTWRSLALHAGCRGFTGPVPQPLLMSAYGLRRYYTPAGSLKPLAGPA